MVYIGTHVLDMGSWYRHRLRVLTTPMVLTWTYGIVRHAKMLSTWQPGCQAIGNLAIGHQTKQCETAGARYQHIHYPMAIYTVHYTLTTVH